MIITKVALTAFLLAISSVVAQAGTFDGFVQLNGVGPFTRIDAMASVGSTLTADPGFPPDFPVAGQLLSDTYETWIFAPALETYIIELTGQQPDTPGFTTSIWLGAFNGNVLLAQAVASFTDGVLVSVDPVPEPASYLLMGGGLMLLAYFRRSRRVAPLTMNMRQLR